MGLTATQINTLLDDLIAWWFSASAEKGDVFLLLGNQIAYPLRRGCVSHLNIAQRLYQVPLGVLAISLATAIFPVMSADAARGDFDALRKTISKGIRGALFIAVPATVGLLLVARPLVAAAFEHGKFTADDTEATARTLLFYTLGLSGFFMQHIVTRAFYSLQDSKVPMRSAVIAVVANVILNITLIWSMGTAGLALSTAICSYLQVGLLLWMLRKRLGHSILDGSAIALLKTTAATLCMCGVVVICLWLSKNLGDILKLLLVVPTATAVYLLAAKLLGIEMFSLLTGGKE